MRQRLIQSRAGRLSWLQFLSLAISAIAYFLLNSPTTALIMLVVATLLGLAATVLRIRQAQQVNQQTPRNRRRR